MKYLIRLFIAVIICTMSTGLFAQNFGLKAGLNLSKIHLKENDENYSDELNLNPGFHLGATAEFPFTKMISLEMGIMFSTKGYKISEEETYDGETYKYKGKMNLTYLDIPLTAKASFNLKATKIYGVFGPYLGMGLNGKTKYEYTYNGQTETDEEDIAWGSDEENDDLRRLDFGLHMGAGLEINYIQVGLTYSLGLAHIAAYTGDGLKVSNRVLGVSVGYKFGGK